VIFLDTSAIYAMADKADPYHEVARERFGRIVDAGDEIVTHNYILGESMALLQNRLGLPAALRLARDVRAFLVEWVDQVTHEEAVRLLARRGSWKGSLVDQVSFLIMQRRRIQVAMAFDSDFVKAGYQIFGGPS